MLDSTFNEAPMGEPQMSGATAGAKGDKAPVPARLRVWLEEADDKQAAST